MSWTVFESRHIVPYLWKDKLTTLWRIKPLETQLHLFKEHRTKKWTAIRPFFYRHNSKWKQSIEETQIFQSTQSDPSTRLNILALGVFTMISTILWLFMVLLGNWYSKPREHVVHQDVHYPKVPHDTFGNWYPKLREHEVKTPILKNNRPSLSITSRYVWKSDRTKITNSHGYDLSCDFQSEGCNARHHPEYFKDWLSHTLSHCGHVTPIPSAF